MKSVDEEITARENYEFLKKDEDNSFDEDICS